MIGSEMRHLCDSNVFLALTASGHKHHLAARAWFENLAPDDTAEFCRMTELAFLRLLTTEAVMRQYVVTNDRALSVYQTLLRHERVRYAELEPVGLQSAWFDAAADRQSAPKRWMDAYLAEFSRLSRMRLVTFDQGFSQYLPDGADLLLLR